MKQRSPITPFLAVLALAGLFLVGCGSSGSESSSTTANNSGSPTTTANSSGSPTTTESSGGGGGGSTETIDIKNFAFHPDTLKAKVGDTITCKNEDDVAHTCTTDSSSDPAKFDTGDIKGGSSKSFKIEKTGTYKYYCSIHNYMTGTIEVS